MHTTDGEAWFKENPPAFAFEPGARALTWHRLGPVERDDPAVAWLEIFDGVADGTITLGEA